MFPAEGGEHGYSVLIIVSFMIYIQI